MDQNDDCSNLKIYSPTRESDRLRWKRDDVQRYQSSLIVRLDWHDHSMRCIVRYSICEISVGALRVMG